MSADDPGDSYVTLVGEGTAEIRIRRSRFVALAAPAADEEAARRVVAVMSRRHHDARHVCWAARLGDPETREIRVDAGEPAGTAGAPILAALRRAELVDTVGVVARWFGGVKLGAGGLARAYGEAAAEALATAARRTVRRGRLVELVLPYSLQKIVRHHLAGHEGRILAEDYGVAVAWTVWLPRGRAESCRRALVEATADELAWRDRGESNR